MALSKFAKRVLRWTASQYQIEPASYSRLTEFVRPSNKVQLGLKGPIATKIVEIMVDDGYVFLKGLPKKDLKIVTEHIAGHLLFGRIGELSAQARRLFNQSEWPISVKRDPVKRIKLFLKTDGRE